MIKTIPAILRQQRNILGLTPDQVVEQLNERGLSISTKALYAYEAGTNLPKVTVFLALCDIYGIRDIMGSFGYSVPLCIGENEWKPDQYEDFFKATLYEKIYLLAKWGIPSFADYEDLMTQPAQIALSDSEIQLIKLYRKLDDRNRESAFTILSSLLATQPGEETNSTPKEA